MVGEECGGGHKQTSITIAGGIGVVNVPYGGQEAWERHNPQNHEGGSGVERRRVIGEVHGKGNLMHQNWEGNVTEGSNDGDPLIANAGEAFFLYIIALRARGRKQGQCRPRLRGRHLHGSW
jgi:hypothetical protein